MFYLDLVYVYFGTCQRADTAGKDGAGRVWGGGWGLMVKRSAGVRFPWAFVSLGPRF